LRAPRSEYQHMNHDLQAINQTMQGFIAQQIILNERLETLDIIGDSV